MKCLIKQSEYLILFGLLLGTYQTKFEEKRRYIGNSPNALFLDLDEIIISCIVNSTFLSLTHPI
jgi:hypothetical protein